ncbi:MAG TPA: class I SAM-dependent methyltransferase [Candidatus Polarisedimenticolia bacterium]|nr:class I SAM-dependent methyltransferase [Candidatus Polarisedimenticolia bacterium]
MQTIEEVLITVDGWLNPKEARLLYRLARDCKGQGAIVEIGSWKGKSTICLARGSLAGFKTKIHAIDPHTGSPEHSKQFGVVWTFDEFRRNIENAGMTDMVIPHVDYSDAVARKFDEPVELVFIDGLHEYEGVKIDFDAWFPKVIEHGTMAFHDTTCWPGVLKVMCEDVFKSPRFRKVRFAKSIVHAEKVKQNTFFERVENRIMLCAFLVHAFMDRWQWRLLHNYLDFPITRSLIALLKKRQLETISVTGDSE